MPPQTAPRPGIDPFGSASVEDVARLASVDEAVDAVMASAALIGRDAQVKSNKTLGGLGALYGGMPVRIGHLIFMQFQWSNLNFKRYHGRFKRQSKSHLGGAV